MNSPYADIIHLPHHVSQNHPQMPMLDRAAQFAPFAALTGYEAAVGETARLTAERRELDAQEAEELNRRLAALITSPMTESEIVYAVCEDFGFLSSRVGRATSSIRTLHTYLDFLVDRGDITIVAHRGMRYFQPTPKLPTPEKKA